MSDRVLFFGLVLLTMLAVDEHARAAQDRRIWVGPNVLVSRDGPTPKTEYMVAANPTAAANLIATAIVSEPSDTCRLYVSDDGGVLWRSVDFAELRENGCGDPQIAFGDGGVAYFAVLTFVPEQGRKRTTIRVYRSADRGRTWDGPTAVGLGDAPDHDQLVVSSHAGEPDVVYITVLNGGRTFRCGLYRSVDGGRTFTGPTIVADGGDRGVISLNPLVLSNGTLLVTYADFERRQPEARADPSNNLFLVKSNDAGLTFTSRAFVQKQVFDKSNPHALTFAPMLFAADRRSARFKDRIYVVYDDFSSGKGRLRLSYSSDEGRTWTPPRVVDDGVPPAANQYRAALAVAPTGVVGVTWLDDRKAGGVYEQYFAASVDGGDSFLPAVKVSSDPSPQITNANLLAHPTIDSPGINALGRHTFAVDVVAKRFPDGGDYVGLAADARGAFHALWPDSRYGASQVWTATIVVDVLDDRGPADTLDDDALNRALRLEFDPIAYDERTSVEMVPIRVRNVSAVPICAPLVARIADPTPHDENDSRILNSTNGESWNGAAFSYSESFGDFKCLEPGGMSNPVVWQFRTDRRGFVSATVRFGRK